MRSRTRYLASLLTAVFLVLPVAATLATRATRASPGTLYVSTDGSCGGKSPCYTNVQDALNFATTGDEIRVATGIYTDSAGTVAEITKTITLQGGWNSDFTERNRDLYPTTLDAQRDGRVVQITGNISPTIDGFVITKGNATDEPRDTGYGGGIHSDDANPIITNNVITDNIGSASTMYMGNGGGLCLEDASTSALISGNQILSNTASTTDWGGGGGVLVANAAATISGNIISDNKASTADLALGSSGGLYIHGDVTVTGNTISGNIASTAWNGGGGGLYHQAGDLTLTSNTIIHNIASTARWGYGGGLMLVVSQATLDGNRIISNTASVSGGGLYVSESTPFTITNNIIARNRADGAGGGILVYGSTPYPTSGVLANNTIAQNSLGSGDEGLYATDVTTLTLTNNIVVSHTYGIFTSSDATVTADYTLFFGNSSNTGAESGGAIDSTNEVSGDPVFVDPATWDYHIQVGSPAINAGTTIPWLTTDIDGDPRPICAAYDIGADEYPWCHIYLPLIMKNY